MSPVLTFLMFVILLGILVVFGALAGIWEWWESR